MNRWLWLAVVSTVALIGVMAYEIQQSARLDADCQSIGYTRGFTVGGTDYCVREIVSPRVRQEDR